MALPGDDRRSSGQAKKIDDIQILRGIAITMVLIYHLSFSTTLLAALPIRLTSSFYAGVELFFVISGFVVTRSLIRSNYEPVGFLIRRVFRLYPPILAFLALSGAVNAIIRTVGRPAFAVDFFCVNLSRFMAETAAILGGYLINLGTSSYMNGAMWSLSVEFQFYAATAVLLGLTLMLRASPRLIGYIIVTCAIAACAVCFYSRILAAFGYHPGFGRYLMTFRFDFLALGVLLAYAPERAVARIMRYGRTLSIALMVAPIGILSLVRSPLDPTPSGPDYLTGVGMVFTAACYVTLVMLAVGGNVSRALPGAVNRLMFLTGERSYTIYLLHFPAMLVAWVIIMVLNVRWTQNAWTYSWVQVVATFMVLLPITELVYRYLELRSSKTGAAVVAAWRQWRSPRAAALQRG